MVSTPSPSSPKRATNRLKKLKRVILYKKKRKNVRSSLLERADANRHLCCSFSDDDDDDDSFEHSVYFRSFDRGTLETNDDMQEYATDDGSSSSNEEKEHINKVNIKSEAIASNEDIPPLELSSSAMTSENDDAGDNYKNSLMTLPDNSFGLRRRRGGEYVAKENIGNDARGADSKQGKDEDMHKYSSAKVASKLVKEQAKLNECNGTNRTKTFPAQRRQGEYVAKGNVGNSGEANKMNIGLAANIAPLPASLETGTMISIPLESTMESSRIVEQVQDEDREERMGPGEDTESEEELGEDSQVQGPPNAIALHTTFDTTPSNVGAFRVRGINSERSLGTYVYSMGSSIPNIENYDDDDEEEEEINDGEVLVEARVVDTETEKKEIKESILLELSSKHEQEMSIAREEERRLTQSRLVAKRAVSRWRKSESDEIKREETTKQKKRAVAKLCGLMILLLLIAMSTWMMLVCSGHQIG